MSKQALKNTTVRLEPGLLEIVQRLARHDDQAPSDLIRTAIKEFIARRSREDPEGAEVISQALEDQMAMARDERMREYGLLDPDPDPDPGKGSGGATTPKRSAASVALVPSGAPPAPASVSSGRETADQASGGADG